MTKEEAIKKAKEHYWFLKDYPEWNSDKEVVLTAVKKDGTALRYASVKLRKDKEAVIAAVNENGWALEYASYELRKDKEIVLTAIARDIDACEFSLLECYKNFNEVVEKEGEGFLFSCWNNQDYGTRLQVANHPNFLPTLEQTEIGLKDAGEVQQVYKLRQDEWISKIEENKLRNTI